MHLWHQLPAMDPSLSWGKYRLLHLKELVTNVVYVGLMINEWGEPTVIDEPVEVHSFRKIINHIGGIYRVYLKLIKKSWKMSTCNRLDLEILGFWPIMSKIHPGHMLMIRMRHDLLDFSHTWNCQSSPPSHVSIPLTKCQTIFCCCAKRVREWERETLHLDHSLELIYEHKLGY